MGGWENLNSNPQPIDIAAALKQSISLLLLHPAARQENNLPLTFLRFCKDGFPE